MQRGNDRLSDRRIKAWLAKPTTKKFADGEGLHLVRLPSGVATWRVKFSYLKAGERVARTFSIGPYPRVGLAEARNERDRVKAWLREGRDPVMARKLARASVMSAEQNTFGEVAEQWLEYRRIRKGWSEIHATKTRQALDKHVLPILGHYPIKDVTPAMVAAVVEPMVRRGRRDTAAKVLQNLVRIFARAQRFKLITHNPASELREELIPEAQLEKHRPALLTFPELGELLRRTDEANLSRPVYVALTLAAYTAQRPGNIISARWDEFDLDRDTPVWVIPRSKMKVRKRRHDHTVLLGPTVATALREWRRIKRDAELVFPSPTKSGKHIGHESMEKVYRRTLGYEGRHSPHGWRSSFATLAKESGLFSKDAVDLVLDHLRGDPVELAYDRGERWEERRGLMFWWDSQLTAARVGADIIPITRRDVA